MTEIKIGQRKFASGQHTYVCGILNVTPDSFSDGGHYTRTEAAIKRAEQMLEEGAELLDIGGESTRPGFCGVDAEEETHRVIPVLRALKLRGYPIPVSVDTSKWQVAAEALSAGADMINDVRGFRADSRMAETVAQSGAAVCLMHDLNIVEADAYDQVRRELAQSLEIALRHGIGSERIILDPGIGFGKTVEQNLTLMRRASELRSLGCPILLGVSRKSSIGVAQSTDGVADSVDQRLYGTLAANLFAAYQGVEFVRVHDVLAHVKALRVLEKILQA